MGDVYKGVHATIGSKVAIKILRASELRDGQARFLREAQVVNRIEHDGVVKVVDAGKLDNGRPFLVMELLDGESLAERHHRNPIPIGEVCAIVAKVLDALAAAHAVDVVHRDLKPQNVFLTKSGRVVVLDFGIAKLVDSAALRLTAAGMAVGTPAYMSPEQVRGKDTVGPASDIYACGVVLYELLCRRLPFGGTDVEIMNGHVQKRPPPPRAIRPEISAALSDLVLGALAKDPEKRFGSAVAMRDALRALEDKPEKRSKPRLSEQITLERPKLDKPEPQAKPAAPKQQPVAPKPKPAPAKQPAANRAKQPAANRAKQKREAKPSGSDDRSWVLPLALIGVVGFLILAWLLVRAPS